MNGRSMDSSRGNILLVDDTPNNLRLLSAMLIEQGYAVRRVINGQMALKTAQANPPDLVLLDIKMPDMNGYEVCQHLKKTAETQDVPVIFISALDEVLDKMKAFAVGGVDYITKPFSEEEVFVRVENSLTIRKLQKQLQIQNERLQQEINKRNQLKEQLLICEAKHYSLFHHSIVGIFRLGIENGLVLDANQRLVELLGYDSILDVVQHVALLKQSVNPALQTKILADLHANHTARHYKMQFCKRDGSLFWGGVSVHLNQAEDCIDGAMIEIGRC